MESEIKEFWTLVSTHKKFAWSVNPEEPFNRNGFSEEMKKYIESMNYTIRYFGQETWFYPNYNAVVSRPE